MAESGLAVEQPRSHCISVAERVHRPLCHHFLLALGRRGRRLHRRVGVVTVLDDPYVHLSKRKIERPLRLG